MRSPRPSAVAFAVIGMALLFGVVASAHHSRAGYDTAKDKLTTQDVVNVVRAGVVEPSEFERGSWRYRVKTNTICVVVVLVSETEAVVVTAWRIRR